MIGGSNASSFSAIGAYLAIDEILKIAVSRGVSLIHPGYATFRVDCFKAMDFSVKTLHSLKPLKTLALDSLVHLPRLSICSETRLKLARSRSRLASVLSPAQTVQFVFLCDNQQR